jgi:hypothetical protein
MMDKLIEDDRLRQRLDQYIRALMQAGVPAELRLVCAAEFIMQQMNPDRRYSGC